MKQEETLMKKRGLAWLLSVALLLVSIPMTLQGVGTEVDAAYAGEAQNLIVDNLLNMEELTGWASVHAEGLEGVTGGGAAQPQVVSSLEEFTRLAGDNLPRTLVIDGRIECEGYGVLVGNNKTIVGKDENATIYGGIRIHNANNIIVSNLNIEGTWPYSGPDDCVEVKNSHHLWFNHLNIWNSTDGNMDITLGSDYITVSWCKFWYTDDAINGVMVDGVLKKHTHRLSNLISSGAGDHEDTDMGRLHVTYHHNWFADHLNERMPRVMYGRVHAYNNYYTSKGNLYCIGADCYASLLVENNYFKDVRDPHIFSYPGNPQPAGIVARGNEYDNTTGTRAQGQKKSDLKVPLYETTNYDYYLNEAKDVPEIVQSYAGTYSADTTVPTKGTLVKAAVEEPRPSPPPLPTSTPVKKVNDNAVTYDKNSDTYSYHGQNKDGSNAYYEIENPFSTKDFSEVPSYKNGKPVWKKGATIAYWVKVPSSAKDIAVLNFNLENDRQMERSDAAKYNLCQAYSSQDPSYSLGKKKTYVDARGREFTVLQEYGKNVCYNPGYPEEGYYYTDHTGGAYYAYEKGTDSADTSNWTYLNYIGQGMFQKYGRRFEEEGGEGSMIQEADISGSFSLYASGSMGYRQDNWEGLQRNPNLDNYGNKISAHIFNQFFYFGNGGIYTLSNSNKMTPVMAEKNQWHYVVAVIQNDWVQFYMDGQEITSDYLNYFTRALNDSKARPAGESFNLGYGCNKAYLKDSPNTICQTSMNLLDFIADEDTVLTVGGMGVSAQLLTQNSIGTPDGAQVKGLEFYYFPVSAKCILNDRIDLSLDVQQEEAPDKTTEPNPTEKPGSSEEPGGTDLPGGSSEPGNTEAPGDTGQPGDTEAPEVSDKPSPTEEAYILGDADGNGQINLADVQWTLKAALHIINLEDDQQKQAADVDGDDRITLMDAQILLRYVLKIIKTFPG